MKYLSLLTLAFLITISGCSLLPSQKTSDAIITYEGEQYYSITGMIVYHNPELDRGDGKQSGSKHRIVSLEVKRKDFLYFDDFFENSGAYYGSVQGDVGTIILGCDTGNQQLLSSPLTSIDTANAEGKYTVKHEYISTPLPAHAALSTVHAFITKPVFSYPLTSDLPDTGRIGGCEAHAKIKDVKIVKAVKYDKYPEYMGTGNKADIFCKQKGGVVTIETDLTNPDNSTKKVGMCGFFDNHSLCEEWSYYQGECQPEIPDSHNTNQ